MIKINLANTLVAKDTPTITITSVASKDTIIRAFLILIPLIGIISFEKSDLSNKNELVRQKNESLTQLTEQLAKVGSVDDIVRQVNEQKKDLDEKFAVMKQIFGLRAQKTTTLMLMQQHIPDTCWLRKISFIDITVNVMGYCSDIQAAHNYISLLSQEKNIFSNISGQDISEENQGSGLYRYQFTMELRQ